LKISRLDAAGRLCDTLGRFSHDKEVGSMRIKHDAFFTVLAALVLILGGCGKTEGTKPASTSADNGQAQATLAAPPAADAAKNAAEEEKVKLEPPAAATRDLLDALRTGDDQKAVKLLSSTAREKASALDRHVTPSASDTARFTVGKVKYIGEDGAQVACTWTDLDEDGEMKTDIAVWVLRREGEGWRIAGVAYKLFEDRDPIVFNFEEPDELLRQYQWIRTELERRTQEGVLQAKDERNEEKSNPR
jgi:hypothetical protein